MKIKVTRLPNILGGWVTRLFRSSHLPPAEKNASAPWGGLGWRWLTIIVWQVNYVQYLLACQKLQRSTPYNIAKNGFPWKRVFRRRHLGRRVTAVTCLRWPTVYTYVYPKQSQGVNIIELVVDHQCDYIDVSETVPPPISCVSTQTRWVPGWRPFIWISWWRHQMETLSALLAICAGNSPVHGEFPAQRPVTRSLDAFFDLRLNKRLGKHWWGWWFETLSRPLWRHRNEWSTWNKLSQLTLTITS